MEAKGSKPSSRAIGRPGRNPPETSLDPGSEETLHLLRKVKNRYFAQARPDARFICLVEPGGVLLFPRRQFMKYSTLSALLILGLAACSGPAAVTPSGGLMYRVPTTPSVVYVSEGSQNIGIDAGAMGSMNMTASSQATLAVTFAAATEGVQVTTSFQEVSASMTQPMGGSISASESDIVGDLVFTLDGKGRGTAVQVPEVKGSAEQLVNPASFVYEFFPRLPGGSVDPGASWTDTIQYDLSTSQGDVSSKSILTYTLVGDTVVDGATLLHVTYEGQADVTGTGMTEGMEVIQAVSGDVSGMFLWDPARGLMVAGDSSQDMDGTVEVPSAGVPPMPVTVSGSGTVRLQGG